MPIALASRFSLPRLNPFARAPRKGDGETCCPCCGDGLKRDVHVDSPVFGTIGVYRIELSCEPCGWRRRRRVGM